MLRLGHYKGRFWAKPDRNLSGNKSKGTVYGTWLHELCRVFHDMTYLVLMKMHAADSAGVSVQGVHAGSALRVPHFQGPAQGQVQLPVR
jgi:hypothetical protein